jgi:hypothetical protein
MDYTKGSEHVYDWHDDPYWRSRRLSPAQIQVYDIRLEGRRDVGAMLEMREVLSSSLLPALERRDELANDLSIQEATRHEQVQIKTLAQEFGWLQVLRSNTVQKSINDSQESRKCRWIHMYAIQCRSKQVG